jgi:hypothetical protein
MRRQVVLIPVLALALVACQDATLKKVAESLKDTAESIGVIQATIIDANRQKLVSDDDTRKILQLCVKVNQAGQEATAITRGLAKLNSTDRQSILKILGPVLASVTRAIDNDLAGIKNEDTKQKVKMALLTIQSALNAAQIALAAS